MHRVLDIIRGVFPEEVPIWVKSLFLVAMALGQMSSVIVRKIVDKINEGRPDSAKESHRWWDARKGIRVFKEYEQRFPSGRYTHWYKICFMSAALAFVMWFLLSIWYYNQL